MQQGPAEKHLWSRSECNPYTSSLTDNVSSPSSQGSWSSSTTSWRTSWSTLSWRRCVSRTWGRWGTPCCSACSANRAWYAQDLSTIYITSHTHDHVGGSLSVTHVIMEPEEGANIPTFRVFSEIIKLNIARKSFNLRWDFLCFKMTHQICTL